MYTYPHYRDRPDIRIIIITMKEDFSFR
jgi:hypothetical protein